MEVSSVPPLIKDRLLPWIQKVREAVTIETGRERVTTGTIRQTDRHLTLDTYRETGCYCGSRQTDR